MGLWDGKVPDIEGVFNAQNDLGPCRILLAYRLACRLTIWAYSLVLRWMVLRSTRPRPSATGRLLRAGR